MAEQVIVYVPAFNVARFLPECIEAIRAQTYPVAGVVVVDDGSSDASAEIAEKHGARVVHHPMNLGLSTARHTAFEQLEAPFIASLDADCVADPNWLESLMKHMDDPAVAGAGGTLIERNRTALADAWRAAHMEQSLGPVPTRTPHMLFGNNNVFRRSAILGVGSYPLAAEYRTNNEDYYISRRLLERGWQLHYEPGARVHHCRTDTIASINRTYWRWFYLHRPLPASHLGLLKKTAFNLLLAARFAWRDLLHARLRLLPFDLLLFPAYQSHNDLSFFRAQRKAGTKAA